MSVDEDMKNWGRIWKRNGPLLEEVWKEDLRKLDTAQALKNLEAAFNLAIKENPPSPTSGLVEMQRIFKRARQS